MDKSTFTRSHLLSFDASPVSKTLFFLLLKNCSSYKLQQDSESKEQRLQHLYNSTLEDTVPFSSIELVGTPGSWSVALMRCTSALTGITNPDIDYIHQIYLTLGLHSSMSCTIIRKLWVWRLLLFHRFAWQFTLTPANSLIWWVEPDNKAKR